MPAPIPNPTAKPTPALAVRRALARRRVSAAAAIALALTLSSPRVCAAEAWVAPSNLAALQAQFHPPTDIPFASDNDFTAERELLGRTLFFEPRISGSGVLACATCHNPSFGWGDGMKLGRGEGMQELGRRTPTILNVAWGKTFFWDGRAPTLESQATGPMSNPKEMNGDLGRIPATLASIPGYAALFGRAYPGEAISIATVVKAIATFERTVVSARTPFDAWMDGDEAAIDPSAKRGFMVFNVAGHCAGCHAGWSFTDNKFHDIGLASTDPGRAAVEPAEFGAKFGFKTPTLRDVASRAPYMHDGSQQDLPTVIHHYMTAGERHTDDPLIRKLDLSQAQISDLIAFMNSLSAPTRSFPVPLLPR